MRVRTQQRRFRRPAKALIGMTAALFLSLGAAQDVMAMEAAPIPVSPAGLLPLHVGGLFGGGGGSSDEAPASVSTETPTLELSPAAPPRIEQSVINPLEALTPFLPAPGEWRIVQGLQFERFRLSDTEANAAGTRGTVGSTAVLSNRTGSAFDPEAYFWFFWGGGGDAYGGNEVYRLDLAVLQMSQITQPSVLDRAAQVPAANNCLVPSDGPAAASTFDGFVWSPDTQSFFVFPSGGFCPGGVFNSETVWEFDPLMGAWNAVATMSGLDGAVFAEYDPATGRIFVVSAGADAKLREFDPVTGQVGAAVPLGQALSVGNAVLDSRNDQMIVFAQEGVFAIPLANPSAIARLTDVPSGFDTGSGAAFDTRSGLIALWDGGKDVRTFDTVAAEWTLQTPASGPTAGPGGVFSKWIAIDELGIFLGYQNPAEGLWLYRLPTTTGPAAPTNTAPIAFLGINQIAARTGRPENLDGTGSFDPEGDPLTYDWSVVVAPAGASPTFSTTNQATTTFTAPRDGAYTVRLTVSDGALSDSATVIVTAGNARPVADAGADQSVTVGDTVSLSGGGSDADGDSLSYTWTLTRPVGSNAVLSGENSAAPSFPADAEGAYTLQLSVDDGTLSGSDQVSISVAAAAPSNTAPVADAGADQTLTVGQTATLSGARSSDPDGDALSYAWTLTAPAGSAATLSDPTAVMPSFDVDLAGTYVARLVVNDGTLDSAPGTVTVATGNSSPVAEAGPAQTVLVADTVTLDGSGSSDVDGNALTFSWSLTAPAGSAATLSDPTAVMPTFDVDLAGTYVAQLVVNDGTLDSAPGTVTVTTGNSPPVAEAGPAQTVLVAAKVTLDGSGSSDVDGDSLIFSWSLTAPAGSTAILSDPAAVMPSFDVDLAGTYVAQLIVNDGTLDSAPGTVTVTTGNSPPVAEAGPAQTVFVTDTVTLDGGGSRDVDGDALTFSWSLTAPAGSSATLSDPAAVMPTFDVDLAGTYVAQLIVNDGTVDSGPDTVTVTTGNSLPVAEAGPAQTVFVAATVLLDGGGSSDVDSDSLTFFWSFTSVPLGSTAALDDPKVANPTFVVDLPGIYVAQLIVNDGTVDSAPDTITIDIQNSAPIADAGADQTLILGQTATLSGAGSSDPDGDALSYAWSVNSAPAGASATLATPTQASTAFTPQQTGSYVFRLIVGDGDLSNIASVTVTVNAPANTAPVANAGPDQSATVGDVVSLSGSGSDADGDSLTSAWSFVARPAGSNAVLSGAQSATPSFPADAAGTYTLRLSVSDGTLSGSDEVSVSVAAPVNGAPIANAGPDQVLTEGQTATLNGSQSSDPDGDSLSYTWSLTRPAGSSASLSSATAAQPTLALDVAGDYLVDLTVSDGQAASTTDQVKITANIDLGTAGGGSANIVHLHPGGSFEDAVESLLPGDTLIVHEGTYSDTGRISIQVKGTASAPVVVKGADGEAQPLITRSSSASLQNTINVEGATYLTIKGLEIVGNGGDGISLNNAPSAVTLEDLVIHDIDVGIGFRSSMSGIVVRGNHIYNTGIDGGTGEGMYIGCNNNGCAVSDTIIEKNLIHDTLPGTTQGDGIEVKPGSFNVVVRENVIHDMKFPCIFVYGNGPARNIVERNVMWNCDEAIQAVSDAVVRNNIVLNSATGITAAPHAQVGQMDNMTIVNNTFFGHSDECLYIRWSGATDMVLANNAVYCAGSNAVNASGLSGAGITVSSNYVEGGMAGASIDNAGFVFGGSAGTEFADAAGFDLWPAAASVLRNAADTAHAPADDYNRMSRSTPQDVGAYETNGLADNPGQSIGDLAGVSSGGGSTGGGSTGGGSTGGGSTGGGSANLVARWAFDDGSGATAADATGGGNTGTVVGGPTWTTGALAGALDLDGSSHYVEVSDANLSAGLPAAGTSPGDDFTLAAWVRLDSMGDRIPIVSKQGTAVAGKQRGFVFGVASTGAVEFEFFKSDASGSSLNSSHNLTAGQWYHLAVTYDFIGDGTSQARIYVNGVESNSNANAVGPVQGNSQPLDIGRYFWSSSYSRYFDGIVDDVSIYGRALNTAEVLGLYNQAAGNLPPPVPTVALTASPSLIDSGQSSTLSWSSSNATACSASGAWSGAKASAGTQAVTPTANATYTLTCTGPGGSASRSASVNIRSSGSGGGTTVSGSSLAGLAASLAPGQWGELQTNNINPTLKADGANSTIFAFTDDIRWNPVTRQLQYVGGDHGDCPRFVVYDEATNTWTNKGRPPWLPCWTSHGYDHNAVDPATGDFFARLINSDKVHRWDGQQWHTLPPSTAGYTRNTALAIEYFPEMNGLLWASVENGDRGGAVLWDRATNSWRRVAQNLPMGSLHHIAEYNPVHKVVIFGGGDGSQDLYSLDAQGNVKTLARAPSTFGIQRAMVTVDPVSGDYLVFFSNGQFWIYDVVADTWTQQSASVPMYNTGSSNPISGAVATPVDVYGVVLFVTCVRFGDCKVMLYKHAQGASGGSTGGGTVVTDANFAAACADADVILCRDFDTQPPDTGNGDEGVFVNGSRSCAELTALGSLGNCPVVDNGRLKFTVPGNSGPAVAGQYFVKFPSEEIMPGESFYVRWDQEFDSAFLNEASRAGGGFKIAIFGDADQSSCATNHLVLNNGSNRGFVQGYHACGVFEGFDKWNPNGNNTSDFDYQPGGPNQCLRSYNQANGTWSDDCFKYVPDETFTFEFAVDVNPNPGQPSRIRLWVTRDSRARELVIDYQRVLIDAGLGYGAVWLLPYNTGKNSSIAHPEGHTWVNNLLVARRTMP